jgi:hypothetical protein
MAVDVLLVDNVFMFNVQHLNKKCLVLESNEIFLEFQPKCIRRNMKIKYQNHPKPTGSNRFLLVFGKIAKTVNSACART